MNKKFTILTAALALLTILAIPIGMRGQTRTAGDEITSISDIVSGKTYYIKGVRSSNTYYLTFTDATGSQSGTESSTTDGAVPITFTYVSENTYNLTTPNGNYIAPGTSNGKINVSSTAINVTASNQNSKIRLSIVSGTNTWSIQKNTSAANFGGYKNTQTDITLIEAGGSGTASDLALTGAPIALTFDLYNNNAAQVINYTTSSTGTVSVVDNDYVTAVVDQTNKKITVTPSAVTLGAQTVTVSQAADATYNAGSVSFTVSVSNSNPDTPGSSADPYTVAEAITATPASGTSAIVCVRGIVSAFYGSNTNITTDTYHRYYISDDGTTTNQLLVYNGKGLNNVDFSNADDLLVGDEVTILGGLTTYNSTKEIAADNYIVTLVRKVATPTFSPAAGAVLSGTEVEISCATSGATIYYTTDGTEPNTSSSVSVYSAPITLTTATTIKAYAVKDSYTDSEVATAAYTIATPVATPTFYPAAGIYSTDQNVAISCDTDGATIYYTTDGSNPTTSSTEYTEPIEVTTDKTIKAIAVKAGMVDSEIATASYTFVAALPFNFNYGKADIANTKGLTQEGLGSDYSDSNAKLKFDNTGDWLLLYFNERPGTLTFKIKNNSFSGGTFKVQTSVNGVDFTDLQTYTSITGTQTEEFTTLGENVRYIKWIYTERSNGNVGLGSIALAKYVAPVPTITVDPTSVNVTAAGDLPEFAVSYENMVITDEGDFDVEFFESDGTTVASQPSWITNYEFNPGATEGYELIVEVTENNTDAQRFAYLKVWALDDVTPVYSDLITITQAAPVVEYATLPFTFTGGRSDIASTSGLTYSGLGTDYSGSSVTTKLKFDSSGDWVLLKLTAAPVAINYDIKGNSFSGGTFTVQVSENDEDYTVIATHTDLGDAQTITLINSNDAVRYIKWVYNTKDGGNVGLGNLHVTADLTIDGNLCIFTDVTVANLNIPIDKVCTIYSGATLNVTTSLSNAATSNAWEHLIIKDGAQLKTPNAVNGTIEKAITGYGTSTNGKYVLLATPATMDACNETGMWPTGDQAAQANIDFYSFDQSYDGAEWRNFKYGYTYFAGPLCMNQGQGYLYANPNDVTLTLQTRGYVSPTSPYEDHPFAATNANINVPMSYNGSKPFAGYNLLGNPFTCNAYINRAYYRMNDAGDAIIAAASATTAIKPCEGIFVLAADGDDNSVTFSTTVPSGAAPANVVINLKESEMVRDRAIVSFGNERNMPRFQFNEAAAKLYIPQGEKEMAKVNSEAQGEMPVNFKADKNGSYTLSIDIEADMDYLHLIDNMTGADVDLLANPSYTFDARTSDYASRFRLVFSANDENGASTGSATFAYFNGSEWVVNSNGNATLQVVDVMGRVLSSETVNGNHNMNLNLSTGVYMLRLVNGNDVKTQKIVVR